MATEGVSWEKFQWRTGAESYAFEITDRGMIGKVSVSDGRSFALPVVVWEAMFDAIKTNRAAREKVSSQLPPRAGARWSDDESARLVAKFQSGCSIKALATEHARTGWAVEGQLARLGLWDRVERRPVAARVEAPGWAAAPAPAAGGEYDFSPHQR